jgi:hypothetical protein
MKFNQLNLEPPSTNCIALGTSNDLPNLASINLYLANQSKKQQYF